MLSFCAKNSNKLCKNNKCQICFNKSFASQPKAKFWSDKNKSSPRDFFKSSQKYALFKCDNKKCRHTFNTRIACVYMDRWCPYCNNHKLCDDPDCQVCFKKSFASCPEAKFWSDQNELTPRQVFKSASSKKYKFKCDDCKHIFENFPGQINSKQKVWCPYCDNKKLCEDFNCRICLLKSFASHPRVREWSYKNDVLPRNVFRGSSKSYLFKCQTCQHIYDGILDRITNGQECPYCNHNRLCQNPLCEMCFENSFASHPKAKFWSDKNEVTPRAVFKYSNKKRLFNCDNNHTFPMRPACVANRRWCPHCKRKTEKKLYDWLIKCGYKPIHNKSFEWCKNINYLPFDFVIEKYKLIIELDGDQHFRQVLKYKCPEEQQKWDIIK